MVLQQNNNDSKTKTFSTSDQETEQECSDEDSKPEAVKYEQKKSFYKWITGTRPSSINTFQLFIHWHAFYLKEGRELDLKCTPNMDLEEKKKN